MGIKQFLSHTRTRSLEFASPATVSRCGMLFMSDEVLDVKRLVAKWARDHTASDPGA